MKPEPSIRCSCSPDEETVVTFDSTDGAGRLIGFRVKCMACLTVKVIGRECNQAEAEAIARSQLSLGLDD